MTNMLNISVLHFNQILQLENEHLPKCSQIKLRNNDFPVSIFPAFFSC